MVDGKPARMALLLVDSQNGSVAAVVAVVVVAAVTTPY
jgi:hypothetical protein